MFVGYIDGGRDYKLGMQVVSGSGKRQETDTALEPPEGKQHH